MHLYDGGGGLRQRYLVLDEAGAAPRREHEPADLFHVAAADTVRVLTFDTRQAHFGIGQGSQINLATRLKLVGTDRRYEV